MSKANRETQIMEEELKKLAADLEVKTEQMLTRYESQAEKAWLTAERRHLEMLLSQLAPMADTMDDAVALANSIKNEAGRMLWDWEHHDKNPSAIIERHWEEAEREEARQYDEK